MTDKLLHIIQKEKIVAKIAGVNNGPLERKKYD
jgi:hypothetical protein